ncbi:hypothetical protein [Kribbella ginsengisoli]|uniref:hypothetical protein n=1 Tax=Kribbella ginsengisoli TaxID=363865 RepID=UPI0031E3EC79
MNCLRWCTRRGSVRALIAVLLLAGVFAMHGLTGNHDAAMAVGHQMAGSPPGQSAFLGTESPVPGQPQAGASAASYSADHGHAYNTAMIGVSGHVESSLELTARPDGHGHIHAMDDVCLGMLVALLLALIVALARCSLTAAHPVQLTASPVLVAVDDPSPLWRRPVLSKLCVLRT